MHKERFIQPSVETVWERISDPYPLSEVMIKEAEKVHMPFEWRLPMINGNWEGKSMVGVEQLTKPDVFRLLSSTFAIIHTRANGIAIQQDQLVRWLHPWAEMITTFYESSSRTHSSFISAIEALGGTNVQNQGMVYSSVTKGENIKDTMRTMGCYAHLVVIRHPEVGAAAIAAWALEGYERIDHVKPQVINGGDGVGEHPTQALTDIATIIYEKRLSPGYHNGQTKRLKDLNVCLLGDLKHGRTTHSLAKLLALLGGSANLFLISPEELAMPREILERLKKAGQPYLETPDLLSVLPDLDVLYVTRLQKERFQDESEYLRHKGKYVIDPEILARAKPDLTVMHPLPRVDEIDPRVDDDPRAAYIRQMEIGKYVRMALICAMLGRTYPNPPEPWNDI